MDNLINLFQSVGSGNVIWRAWYWYLNTCVNGNNNMYRKDTKSSWIKSYLVPKEWRHKSSHLIKGWIPEFNTLQYLHLFSYFPSNTHTEKEVDREELYIHVKHVQSQLALCYNASYMVLFVCWPAYLYQRLDCLFYNLFRFFMLHLWWWSLMMFIL